MEQTRPDALALHEAMPSLPRGAEHTFESVARRLAELNAGIAAVRTQAHAADRAAAGPGATATAAAPGSGADAALAAGGGPGLQSHPLPSLLLGDGPASGGSLGSLGGAGRMRCCRVTA